MLIIGIDPGITGSICFFKDGKIIDVIEMPNMPEGKKNNWVPIPKEGIFKLNFRNYMPKETLLNKNTVENYLPGVVKNKYKIKG